MQGARVKPRERFGGLWQHPNFLKLWAAQTTSRFGTQITLLAVPLTAVLTLDAGPAEMGRLTAASQAAFLLVGLVAGVWVDRLPRRPILIVADLGRFVLLAIIPLLALADALRIEHLYLVVFLVGILTVFFDVADHSYLPALIGRSQLTEANSKLSLSRSLAQSAGPGAGGWLVSLLTAPIAILLDALTYLVSALFVWSMRTGEPERIDRGDRQSIVREIREGVAAVVGHPLLRPIAASTATSNLFLFMMRAVLILYATRSLEIGPGLLGLVFTAGGLGAGGGAALAARVANRIGVGPSIVTGSAIGAAGMLLIPLAQGPAIASVPLLMAAQILGGLGGTIYNINQISLRLAITPDRLLGRMNATMRFIVWGTIPIGGLLGGFMGETIGLRSTLVVGAVGGLLAVAWVGLSRVRTLCTLSVPDEGLPFMR